MYSRNWLMSDGPWGLGRRIGSLQEDLDRAFGLRYGFGLREYPPVNMCVKGDDVIVEAEIPGMDGNDIEASVTGDALTIAGERKKKAEDEGAEACHRCERRFGKFSRVVDLPFRIQPNRVSAQYKNGVLRITLQRADEDRVKHVKIAAAE